ncbi:MAG: VCBS repeat-containing protein, partial [Nitrospinota bacterium]
MPIAERFSTLNSADISERCGAERIAHNPYLDILYPVPLRPSKPGEDKDLRFIDMILWGDIRAQPFAVLKFAKLTDYYRRRKELQAKYEDRLASMPADVRRKGDGNYAMTLVYLGEFEKVLERFGPGAAPGGLYESHGVVRYALTLALFRLGRYKESLEQAERAHELLAKQATDSARDTRWQMMLNQLALYGPDFFEKFSCPGCSAKHLIKAFPNRDASKLPFEDVTEAMGLPVLGGYASTIFADFDGDGWDDLFWARKFMPPQLYRNAAGRSFEQVPAANLGVNACNKLYAPPVAYAHDGRNSRHVDPDEA